MRALVCVVTVLVLAISSALPGCGNSIYHQARNTQPPDLAVRLRVRLEEGRRIAEQARTEAANLARQTNPRDQAVEAGLLAVRGHDLRRAAASIGDVASRLPGSTAKSASLDAAKAMERAAEATILAGEAPAADREERLDSAMDALGKALEAAGQAAGL